MNYLDGKTAYLCGAISGLGNSGIEWRDAMTNKLQRYGVKVLDPTRKTSEGVGEIGDDKDKFRQLCLDERWTDLDETFEPVARWDLRSVDKADFIIVNYNAEVPSIGTWHEVVVASWQKKPILLKYDRSQLSMFNPWIPVLIKTNHFFPTWEGMFDHLDIVNEGTFDKKLWTL